MNLFPGLNWLTAITARRTPTSDKGAPDPGDMGTAFGLDATMEPQPTPSADAPQAKTQLPWGQRVVRRPQR
jgi:hypothetical protein